MKFSPRYIVFLLCLCLCLLSGWKVYGIYSEYRQGEKSYEVLTEQFVTPAPQKAESASAPTTETAPSEVSLPTEPETAAPITVDFGALLAACPDVVGWIYSPDTPINYPVVQAEDNTYYLDRLLDGTWNGSGSIFMDYRSAGDFSGWNTILYGHNMKNASMFGTLQKYKKQEYYDAHPVLYLLTLETDYQIELIGGYTTSGETTNANGFPTTQEERDDLVAAARQNSTFQSAVEIRDGEPIITLSTCAYEYENARYVLVGVLRAIG